MFFTNKNDKSFLKEKIVLNDYYLTNVHNSTCLFPSDKPKITLKLKCYFCWNSIWVYTSGYLEESHYGKFHTFNNSGISDNSNDHSRFACVVALPSTSLLL